MSRVDKNSNVEKHRGFTLIELIVVMTIVGVVYALLVQNFTFKSGDDEQISIATIPNFLRKKYGKDKSLVTLRCIDECKKCYIFLDSKKQENELDIFKAEKEVLVYKLATYGLKKIEFSNFYVDDYNSEEICFEYNLYPNGSSDKIIVEHNDKVYFLRNYEQETKVFSSVEEAEEFWQNEKEVAVEE